MKKVELTEDQIYHLIDLLELDTTRIYKGETLVKSDEDKEKLTSFNYRLVRKLQRSL